MPDNISEETKDLINKLLVLEPDDRIGAKDINELKQHPYFNGIDFGKITTQSPPVDTIPPALQAKSRMEFEQNQSITKNEELGLIVYQGELKKKNQYLMK